MFSGLYRLCIIFEGIQRAVRYCIIYWSKTGVPGFQGRNGSTFNKGFGWWSDLVHTIGLKRCFFEVLMVALAPPHIPLVFAVTRGSVISLF